MKRWIKNIWESTVIPIPPEDREEFVPLEDDPVGALLERQRAAMSQDEMTPDADNEPIYTVDQSATHIDEERSIIPEEDHSMLTPLEPGTKNTPESEDEKSEVASSSTQIGTIKDINESAREVTVMNTSEPQNQQAVEANTTDSGSEPIPSENAQLAPNESIFDEVESETEQIASSEDDAEDGNSEGLLDIFREEEKEANDFYFQTLEEVGMDSLLGEANQVFKEINLRRGKTI